MDCSEFTKTYTPKALAQNLITQDDIDSRIRNLFRVRFRLGHFDPPGPMHTLGAENICSEYAVELARDGATQGAVLIKNAGSKLPLHAENSGKVAVIGPNANLSSLDSGYYGVRVLPNLIGSRCHRHTTFELQALRSCTHPVLLNRASICSRPTHAKCSSGQI